MSRRPWFWVVFALLGVGGAVAATQLFSVALPNISVEISMDRGEALARAAELAAEYGWGGLDDRDAASFGLVDPEVQTYVELEGGGRDAFTGLAEDELWEPYQWRVRRFDERRVEEALVSFTPTGEPYGFELRLGEDEPGDGNLDAAAARALAEETARAWGVELDAYRLLESSQETMPGGRLDHELVFERVDVELGDARFRLSIRIGGSRVAELTRFVYVPQAFSRGYADMRATNDMIALVSQAVFMLVFVLLGAGVGSALLLRSRWLEWRTPLAWGAVIAFFFGLNTANQLPLAWMGYDTARSATGFVLEQLGGSIAIGVLGTPLIAFFLLAGESLGRRAFPGHVQQWRFWSTEVASSSTALGMTIAAYLLVGLQLGYVMLFYLGTQRLDGWWSPADALVQPDLLATYLPWLQAVSIALFASFWEESVFRAVPIACAALLGQRYGRRGLWIWAAVAIQAVVFAAAHANYPQQPPYARVIELTAPAFLWGVVYVFFGLVPTILAHFLYDLSLISLVLFESRALLDQLVIIAVALVPLGVVLVARAGAGARARPPEWALNGAWRPRGESQAPLAGAPAAPPGQASAQAMPEAPGRDAHLEQTPEPAPPGPHAARPAPAPTPAEGPPARAPWPLPAWSTPLLGAAGALLWIVAQVLQPAPPRLTSDEEAARVSALAELSTLGVTVADWTVHVTAGAVSAEGREYVYEEAGPAAYAELSGSYFDNARWLVRLVDWDAEPEARVEEYRVQVDDSGRVVRVQHVLPEARPGASLDAAAARALALQAVEERLGVPESALDEVEAEETSLPARTDWTFTFTQAGLLQEVEGQARVQVRVAGDEVVDLSRSVRVPEEWMRARRDVQGRRTILAGGLGVLLVIAFGAAAIMAVVAWSQGALAGSAVLRLGLPVLAALLISALNALPVSLAGFSTTQPPALQGWSLAIALVLVAAVSPPAIGLVGALATTWLPRLARPIAPRGTAAAVGLLAAGLVAVARAAVASPPVLPDYSGAATLAPFLDPPLEIVMPYFLLTSSILAVLGARARFSYRPTIRSGILTMLVVGAVVIVPASLQDSLPLWGLAALSISVVLLGALRLLSVDPGLVPGVVATVLALGSVALVIDAPYPGARMGGVLATALATVLGVAVTRLVRREAAQSREATRASVGNV